MSFPVKESNEVRCLKIFGAAIVTAGLVPLFFGGVPGLPRSLSQLRNPMILATVFGVLVFAFTWVRHRRDGFSPHSFFAIADDAFDRHEERIAFFLCAFFSVALLKTSLLDFWTFHLNAHDYSMYDYAMRNTWRGRFMEGILGADHFGTHATPVLLLFTPLHFLFKSPLVSTFLHWGSLAAALPVFSRVLKELKARAIERSFGIYALGMSFWMGRIVHYGFHVETLYLPFLMGVFFYGWRGNLRALVVMTLLTLSVKEDAAFYLVGFFLFLGWQRKISGKVAIGLTVFSFMYLVFCLKVWIPSHAGTTEYALAGAVLPGGFGSLFTETVFWRAFREFFTGEWLKAPIYMLALPVITPFFWIVALPCIGIHIVAESNVMRGLLVYYSAPLVPMIFIGCAFGLRTKFARRVRAYGPIALLCSSFFCSGYMIFREWDGRGRDLRALTHDIPISATVCAQQSIVPVLDYYKEMKLLTGKCIDERMDFYIIEPQHAVYPFDPRSFRKILLQLETLKKAGYIETNWGSFRRLEKTGRRS